MTPRHAALRSAVLIAIMLLCLPLQALAAGSNELNTPVPAPDPATNGRFGWSAALDGNFALVGEPGASFARRNLAHIFQRSNGAWSLYQTLVPTGAGIDGFGLNGVDISGGVAVVGASLTIPERRGAAVVFERIEDPSPHWVERTQIDPLSGGSDRRFGQDVSADAGNGLLLVGAPGIAGGALINTVVGSAFVFDRFDARNIDYWNEVVEISPVPTLTGSGFGHAVSLRDDVAVVGSPRENDNQGAVYVFMRNQGGSDAWGQVARLTLADGAAGDRFGFDIAVTASPQAAAPDWLAVGAPGRGTSGKVVLLHKPTPTADWTETQELEEAAGVPGPFGSKLDLDGDDLIVGNTTGISVLTRGATHRGVASVFRRTRTNWNLVGRYETPGTDHQGLGFSVAVSGSEAIAGVPLRDAGAVQSAGAIYSVPIPLFADGFESGSTTAWSSTSP